MKKNIYLKAFLVLFLGLSFQTHGYSASGNLGGTLQVEGKASILVKPDQALVSFGAFTQEESVTKTRAKNIKIMNSILAKLKQKGISKDQIQTTKLTLNPSYSYSRDPKTKLSKRTIQGYEMEHIIRVRVLKIESLDSVISSVTQNMADVFKGIQFETSQKQKIYNQALKQAFKNAQEHSKALASASGLSVDFIQSIKQNPFNDQGYTPLKMYSGVRNTGGIETSTGLIEIKASVQVQYRLK